MVGWPIILEVYIFLGLHMVILFCKYFKKCSGRDANLVSLFLILYSIIIAWLKWETINTNGIK